MFFKYVYGQKLGFSVVRGVLVITTAQLHSTKPELNHLIGKKILTKSKGFKN